MVGLKAAEGRMMIDSVVWALISNVTDRQIDSHVTIAIAALTHCVARQKLFQIIHSLEGSRRMSTPQTEAEERRLSTNETKPQLIYVKKLFYQLYKVVLTFVHFLSNLEVKMKNTVYKSREQ